MKLAAIEALKSPGTGDNAQELQARKKAAQQFEGLLVRELVRAMRSTAPTLQEGQGKSYMEMFDSALADYVAESGGLGIAPIVAKSFGGSVQGAQAMQDPLASRQDWGNRALQAAKTYGVLQENRAIPLGPTQGAMLSGETGRLQQIASQVLSANAGAWGKSGVLGPLDLQSDFSTRAGDGEGLSHFNVQDASGYAGSYKCNLFALEIARRSGFKVPLVAREAGWGYPSSESVTSDATTGAVEPWAQVATGATAEQLDSAIVNGGSAFMISGAGSEGRAGHMALVERVREIHYDDQGQVAQVVFDGWEARSRGAQYLTERTWNLRGQSGGHLVRGGFSRIEILELQRAADGQRPEQPLQTAAPRSWLDTFRSSLSQSRPNP